MPSMRGCSDSLLRNGARSGSTPPGPPRMPCMQRLQRSAAERSARRPIATTVPPVIRTAGSPAPRPLAIACAGPRLLATAAAASDDSTLTLMTLVTRLAVLAEAVAELRLAQRRAAQAAAARRAAEHLHAAPDSVTSRPGEFLRTRPQTAAQTARLDAPVPLRLLSQQRSTPSAAQPAPCGTPGHTRDLHRQDQLMACYTTGRSVPTVIWDKDLQLPLPHLLRLLPNVAVC